VELETKAYLLKKEKDSNRDRELASEAVGVFLDLLYKKCRT